MCRVGPTVTISYQRSYIKIEALRVKSTTEIHGALSEVCGEFTLDRSTISRLANRFRGGCVSTDNDPRTKTRKAENINRLKKYEVCRRCF